MFSFNDKPQIIGYISKRTGKLLHIKIAKKLLGIKQKYNEID